ncbi:hypothetical protein EGW53_10020 [Enterococcus faecium]|nr:hypothetical protein EGW14_10020 [Enterococcus faecium]ROX75961.1 hypothetical protein EGW11_10530 [Enterococcus faecium]ROX88013.1 hypothetical protein EGW41_10600 [Enterococcus faecium]ROY05734.1 hypothetical protein EGW53_10020 [Enterococcus faecium]ROY27565.1 hypothetical protein EGW52_11005 [Enterococcus faecium]
MRITQTEMTFHSQFLSNYIQKQNKKEVFMLIEARKKELLVLQMVIQKVKSRLLCKMLYNVFTISTYQN